LASEYKKPKDLRKKLNGFGDYIIYEVTLR
ncbi:MAG: hypothetical protein UZ08_BCD001000229, partial [Candidatus Parvibacillus calidus]